MGPAFLENEPSIDGDCRIEFAILAWTAIQFGGLMERAECVADVCIIGAGPAGITIARDLATQEVKTVLIESGDREFTPSAQRPNRGESDGYPLHRLDDCRVRAFGGTLQHPRLDVNGWAARPLDAIDFEPRPNTPGNGWPFDRASLDPFYHRAVRTFPMRTPEDAEAWWRSRASQTALDLARDELEATVFQFRAPSFDESWAILNASDRVQVMLGTRVVDLRSSGPDGKVTEVVAVREERDQVVIKPRLVVVAAGGIENARILLTARGCQGLGNEHDLVGRYFSERLTFHGGHVVLHDGVVREDLLMLHRPPGVEAGGGLRVSDSLQRQHGLLNCAFFLMPRPLAVTRESLRSLSTLRKALSRRPILPTTARHVPKLFGAPLPLAEIAFGRFRPRPQTLVLRTQGEQSPHPDSRVTLGSRRDDLGLPVARVTWRILDDDFGSVRQSASILDQALRARHVGRVEWTADDGVLTLVEGNHHHLGTTRMDKDPRHGVVDAHCRVHSVPNLYIAGSSIFPRYGASNPTLTIVALAHRLADHLCQRLRTG
jgi:choline dehydrogenase-like flavoprotein